MTGPILSQGLSAAGMHNAPMRLSFLALLLTSGLLAVPAQAGPVPPQLSCDVTYAGATQRVQARPVADPYGVPSVDIGGRFFFKAAMVQGPQAVERITLSVYVDTPSQPVLVQQARYLPPYPRGRGGRPADLTGEQRVYAGPLERELIYQCWLDGGRP